VTPRPEPDHPEEPNTHGGRRGADRATTRDRSARGTRSSSGRAPRVMRRQHIPVRRALRRRRRRRRRIPPVAVFPTLCTLGNLVAGFSAIHYAAKPLDFAGPWGWSSLTLAGVLIFVGMFFDAVDGSLARLTRSTTDVGAYLDSLADLVTFGVAPAFMMLQLVSYYLAENGEGQTILGPEVDSHIAKALWGIAAIYLCCTAMRLARFNVETPSETVDEHMVFRGLPSPGAGGVIASLIIFHQHWLFTRDIEVQEVSQTFAQWVALGMPVITLFIAFAMISSLPYVHLVNRYVRARRSFKYVARIAILLAVAVWWPPVSLPIAFLLYAGSAPMRAAYGLVRRWWHKPAG